MNIIGDEQVEEALTFLAESAKPFADARALRVVSEEKLRIIRSDLFMRFAEGKRTVAEREAMAFSHPEYKVAVADLGKAVATEELLRCERLAASTRLDCWRTLEASKRTGNV